MSKLDDILIDLDAGDRSVEETKQELIKLIESLVPERKQKWVNITDRVGYKIDGWNDYFDEMEKRIKNLFNK